MASMEYTLIIYSTNGKLLIANTRKYMQSDWLRGVQYWPYFYSVFNICTLLLNNNFKKSTFDFRSGKKEMYSLKTN